MSFPRYPAYKDGGVEWLGEVPEYWEVKQLRHLCECLDGKRIPLNGEERSHKKGEIPYWGANGIVDYLDEWIFDEELVLLGEDGAPFLERDKTVSFFSNGKIWPNNHVHVLRPYHPNGCKFMVYCLNSFDYARFITGSTRDKLNQAAMNSITIPWPPANVQVSICQFLDHETAKIDALIAEQQRLIELLKEKRQAVISHAVTKGLNPDAPMKDSGVGWLGEVPEHWELKRLKHISPYLTVGIVVNPSTYVADEGLPFIYGGDIREGLIHCENARRISFESSLTLSKTQLRAGDLLMVRVGAPGVSAVVPPQCEGGNCASVMLIRQGAFSSQWLSVVLNTRVVRFQVEVVQYGAAQEQFNISHAVNFWVPMPPREEQNQIAAALTVEMEKADSLIEEAQCATALLQERRSALISAAVTGQIDVRGLVDMAEARN